MRPGATAAAHTLDGHPSALGTDSAGPSALQPTGPGRSQSHKARLWHSREGSELRIPASNPHPPLPLRPPEWSLLGTYKPDHEQQLVPGGATAGDAPQNTGKILQTSSSKAGCSELVCSPDDPLPPQNFAQDSSGHTCSIQKFLVHTVSEAAEQAMGPHHTFLQILSGDGIIRVPLLHLTAEGKGGHSKDAGGLLGPIACTAGKHGLAPAMALGSPVKVTSGEPQNCQECRWRRG